MYEFAAQQTWSAYQQHLSGNAAGVVGVLSARPLGAPARHAFDSSANALGFGRDACFFCSLRADDGALQPTQVLELIEGLDPMAVALADAEAIHALSDAYRTGITPMTRTRVFGRNVVAFRDFESMLDDPADKQRAWAVLKLLAPAAS